MNQFRNNYIAFSLDRTIFLEFDNARILGGLTNERLLEKNSNIVLKYMSNIQIANNYYIYYTKESSFAKLSSPFCFQEFQLNIL